MPDVTEPSRWSSRPATVAQLSLAKLRKFDASSTQGLPGEADDNLKSYFKSAFLVSGRELIQS